MEEASRATGAAAPAGAGFEVEMARVAIAGIKDLTGAAKHLLALAKSRAGEKAKEGQLYTAVRESALSRASRSGIGESMGKQGGAIGATVVDKGFSVAVTGFGLAGGRREALQ